MTVPRSMSRAQEIAVLAVVAVGGLLGAWGEAWLGKKISTAVLLAVIGVVFSGGAGMFWRAITSLSEGQKASRDLALSTRDAVRAYLRRELHRVFYAGVALLILAAIAAGAYAALGETDPSQLLRASGFAYIGFSAVFLGAVVFVSLSRLVFSASDFLTQIDDQIRMEKARANDVRRIAEGNGE